MKLEQSSILARFPLSPGIASNHALEENFFASLMCCFLPHPIPVVIVGMPGSSKTLSVRHLIDCLMVNESEDPFVKGLKELSVLNFQGSSTCRSETVMELFYRAIHKSTESGRRVLVFFDEIGLAENADSNPLKVLHQFLEVGQNKFAFVGISNWELDASKMSRMLVVSRPNPTSEDLGLTSATILRSYGHSQQFSEIVLHKLGQAF